MIVKAIAILAAALVAQAAPQQYSGEDGGAATACELLQARFPHLTFYPNTSAYEFESKTQIWAVSNYKEPACVFAPEGVEQVCFAVTTFTHTDTATQFAVRGGGHMPIPGANNIDAPGVLLSMTNLKNLTLSADKSVVSVGSGNRWLDVYEYLQPYGLVVVGGRVGEIGVPGLLLGGGISFYSNQHGFAANNVVKYECVLANGTSIEITADDYSDLFWALKGGGNSFCIVTRFDLQTFESPKVWVGTAHYSPDQAPKFLDAVYNFGKYGSLDARSALTPIVLSVPSQNMTSYSALRFYDSEVDSPETWANFSSPNLTPSADDYSLRPVASFLKDDAGTVPGPLRRKWRAFSSLVDREALETIHSIFLRETSVRLSDRLNTTAGLAFQPITAEFIRQGDLKGGNPHGLNSDKAPYFWTVLQLACATEDDFEYLQSFAEDFYTEVTQELKNKGLHATYVYLNDAGEGQRVFENYGKANHDRLESVRANFDPLKVYIDLMPGGWKVCEA